MKTKRIFACAVISAFFAVNFGYMLFPLSAMAEAVNSKSGFNFVAAGDWGCGNAAETTFSMMKKMKPELYLGLGDYSYEPSVSCWFDIVKEAGPLLKVVVGITTLKNQY